VVRLRAGFDRAQFRSATSEQLKQAVRTEIEQLFSKFTSVSAKVTA
jgi:ribonuclease P protein component